MKIKIQKGWVVVEKMSKIARLVIRERGIIGITGYGELYSTRMRAKADAELFNKGKDIVVVKKAELHIYL